MRPNKIVRDDKVQGIASAKPPNQKYTFEEANQDRDKTNEIIDYLPIYLTTDISGVIDDPILEDKNIGMIMGGGAVLEETIHFTKATDVSLITMVGANTLLPNYKYLLITR